MRLKLFIIFFMLKLFVISCGNPPETEPDPEPDSSAPTINNAVYDIGNSNTDGLFFEYSKYYFLEEENRPIYIWGNDNGTKMEYVWFEEQHTGTIKYLVAGKGPSRFWDRQRFVLPIQIRTTEDVTINDLNSLTFNCGTYPNVLHNTFTTFEQIEERYFKIHYSYMLGYDIFKNTGNQNFNTKQRVKNEFSRANTELEISNDQTTTNNSLLTLTNNYANELITWVYNYVPPNDPKNNFVGLYGMRGYIQGAGFPADAAFSGIMIPTNSETNIKHGYAFVFEEKLATTYRKEDRVVTTVHELGHARGMRLESTESYVPYLATSEQEHKDGHNGTYKNTCVMHWGSTRTTEQIQYMYKKPRFCEGHKQMLLNISFVEE